MGREHLTSLILLCSCAFEREGVQDLAPYTWTASMDGQPAQSGEVVSGCGWDCVPGESHQAQAEMACANGERTVVVVVRCDVYRKSVSAAFLDGCLVKLSCGSMGI